MKTTLIRRLGLLIVAACVVLAGGAAFAQADVVTNEWMSVDGDSFGNPCNGETVFLSGEGHALMATTTDANGGTMVKVHANFADVSGVGSLGNTYRIPTAINATLNMNGASTQTYAAHISLISQGSAPNVDAFLLMHVTVNANGDTTADVTNLTPDGCKG